MRQVEIPLVYKSLRLERAYKADLLIEDSVIVELEAVEQLSDVHRAQLLTYLRMTGKRVGLLLNFNVTRMKDGIIRRIVCVFDLVC